MRLAYSLLLYLAAPFLWLRALWKAESRESVAERFGHAPACAIGVEAWVHAVSVGEAMAALPLIRALVSQFPGRILVTASTETGSETLPATRQRLQAVAPPGSWKALLKGKA